MKYIVGSIESVDLPELELIGLDAKVDTGAENCSIHCDDIKVKKGVVTFKLHDEVHPAYHGKKITLPIFRKGKVRSSNGKKSKRIFIKTIIKMFGQEYEAEISLSDRSKMKYPMLLGKQFLKGNFLVDVEQDYVNMENNKC